MDANGVWQGLMSNGNRRKKARVLVIGAGSRGNTYARAIDQHTEGIVVAVADPIPFKRRQLGKRYIWKNLTPSHGQEFSSWQDFLAYEQKRRDGNGGLDDVENSINAVLVCALDTQHAEIIKALAPLKLHILCEKPLATTLNDCLDVYGSLQPTSTEAPKTIFAIAHVLRYTPHNMLLRKLLLEDLAIGDILSIEHTEPVGYWHFSHSYVRGNWRKESTTAPSLLTKSCHDIDFLLWMLCDSNPTHKDLRPRLPRTVTSTGHLSQFKRNRKPPAASSVKNCTKCFLGLECKYSAIKIYNEQHLERGRTGWPVKIVDPEIEDIFKNRSLGAARNRLFDVLSEDYDQNTPKSEVEAKNWFGRCVWECDNDVCDDQYVTMSWDEDFQRDKPAMTANFHMIASTEAQCARRGRIYGTDGEISYDSSKIEVIDFRTRTTKVHEPSQGWEKSHSDGGHGGGDEGLAGNFVAAVEAVLNGETAVAAQKSWLGVTLDDIIRSHAMVFAAEDARKGERVVRWNEWWDRALEDHRKSTVEVEAKNGWQVV